MKKYIFLTMLVIVLVSLNYVDKNNLKTGIYQEYVEDMISFNKIFFNRDKNVKVNTMIRREESKAKEILDIVKKYEIFEFITVSIKDDRVYIGVEVEKDVSIVKYVNVKTKIKKEILSQHNEIKDVILTDDIKLLESMGN